MNILIYRNQLLQEVATGAYFCDISNSTKKQTCKHRRSTDVISEIACDWLT